VGYIVLTPVYSLNAQHKLLVDIVGGPIDKSIPLENITSVADVGTGTG
jgi:hypothetical protein